MTDERETALRKELAAIGRGQLIERIVRMDKQLVRARIIMEAHGAVATQDDGVYVDDLIRAWLQHYQPSSG